MLDRVRMVFVAAALLSLLAACGNTASQTPAAQPAATAGASAATLAGGRTFRIVPEQTEASYEVQEQFLNRNLPSKAIGTKPLTAS